MKKLLFVFPIIALLAAGCNSSRQAISQPPVQTPVVKNTNTPSTPSPTLTSTSSPVMADQTKGWNTYIDSTYGFQIMLPPDYQFMGETVKNPTGGFVLTAENQQFNNSIKSPSGIYLALNVMQFSTKKDISQACGPGGNEVGSYGGFSCDGRDISQDDIMALVQTIMNTDINKTITLPSFFSGAVNGTVVDLGGHKGLLVVARNTQAPGSTASVYWFSQSYAQFWLYQELDPSTVAEAIQTPQYQTFLNIVSSFKFTK